jgi:transforming growth factor-beta-induced protein
LANQTITITAGTPPTIADTTDVPADIVATDVRASNGLIHVIDKVLIPTL